ncbi:hypothetical protein Zmor_027091 [Zophobas morio]|jgi:hypothetical protein|uniref:Uncharacterized protein n=1 Tax=Zophobas morio TaxID=2755281 RepID=A0AA38HJ20_9CUCU|nr:hypothetical protein Zmor_027091 [Zophobas morio]
MISYIDDNSRINFKGCNQPEHSTKIKQCEPIVTPHNLYNPRYALFANLQPQTLEALPLNCCYKAVKSESLCFACSKKKKTKCKSAKSPCLAPLTKKSCCLCENSFISSTLATAEDKPSQYNERSSSFTIFNKETATFEKRLVGEAAFFLPCSGSSVTGSYTVTSAPIPSREVCLPPSSLHAVSPPGVVCSIIPSTSGEREHTGFFCQQPCCFRNGTCYTEESNHKGQELCHIYNMDSQVNEVKVPSARYKAHFKDETDYIHRRQNFKKLKTKKLRKPEDLYSGMFILSPSKNATFPPR